MYYCYQCGWEVNRSPGGMSYPTCNYCIEKQKEQEKLERWRQEQDRIYEDYIRPISPPFLGGYE